MRKIIAQPFGLDRAFLIKPLFVLLLVTCHVAVFAKNPDDKKPSHYAFAFTVSGKVVDDKGNALGGASVAEKGQSNATVTAADGSFSINIQRQSAVLVFSFVGYQPKEVSVNSSTSSLSIQLTAANNSLEDVIVVGYGKQKKATVTGAVSSVKGSELIKAPVPNITNSVSGRVAGVVGRQSGGGQPGNDNTNFSIRGVNTIGNNAPLIVVDNVIRNNINQIDPNIIESVTILKDAAATAPYGLGGANGVVLITTKQGKLGAPSISLNAWYGTQGPTFYPEILSAQDYMRLRNEAYLNETPGGTNLPFAQTKIDTYLDLNAQDPDKNPIATPKDIVDFHAPQQNYSLQMNGGSDRVKYFTSLGFFNQKGMFPQITYTRYTYNLNLEAKVTNSTTFAISLNGSQEKNRNLDPGHNAGNLLRSTYKYIPTDPYKFSNGLWGASVGLSPYATLVSGGYSRQYGNTMLSSASLEQKLPIKGLSVKAVMSYDPYWQSQKQYHKPFYYYTVNTNTTPYTYNKVASTSEGLVAYTYLFERFDRNQTFTYQGYINYHNTFGKHDITGLVVGEARNGTNQNHTARINNYSLDVDEFNFGSSNKNDYTIGGTSGTNSQVGVVYRVGDAIAGKYIVEASGRYDGHYYFAPGKQYAYFPAFSLGWIASKEKFMQDLRWLNYFKLRGSWGKSGSLAGNPFQFVNAYTLLLPNNQPNAYAFNGVTTQATSPTNQANPFITWEEAVKSDIGFDANLFNGLLNVEFDVFKQKRSNMLVNPGTTVSQEYGIGLSQINAAKMKSSGFEITLGSSKKINDLLLNFNGTFSYNNNELVEVFETSSTYNNPNRRRTGRPNNSQFGYLSDGLFTKGDDKNGDNIINTTDGYTIAQFGVLHPGDIRYKDISGPDGKPDGKIDANDETYIGNQPQPLINYGFTLDGAWKGIDASVFFQGSTKSMVGVQGFLTVPFINNNSNAGYEYFNNRYIPGMEGTAKYPRVTQSPYSNNTQTSDFWIRDASFLKLRTATIGYTLPGSVMHALKIKSIRVYGTGQNIVTFSKIDWIDPELAGGNNGNQGAGNGVNPGSETIFPLQKSWTVGVNITF
jgi:TonB-linked SusC/RagA family outer membrane protein